MTALKPYLAYRVSGQGWLGETPSHWKLTKLGSVVRALSGGTPPMGNKAYWVPELPWVTSKDMKTHRISSSAMWISQSSVADGKTTVVPAGSVLVVVRSGILRHTIPVAVTGSAVTFNQDIKALLPRDIYLDARYLAALIRGNQGAFLTLWSKQGATVESLEIPWMMETEVALPPLGEQRAIADFLDVMDARISRYIAAKHRLIALLEEQKQVIINQAVTRGLDPNVPLKSSGVGWLGDIPAHWDVTRLKHTMSRIVDCLHATPQYSDTGRFPAIRTSDVVPGRVLVGKAKRVNEDVYGEWTGRLVPKEGDILYSREGERYGIAASVPCGVDLCISQRMMVFRPRIDVDGRFFMWQLNAGHVRAQADTDVAGATAPHINIKTIREYALVQPPLIEQQEIAFEIEYRARRFDVMADRERACVSLVNEYQTRLISDVVTGKLDVRGVELPAVEEYVDDGIGDAVDDEVGDIARGFEQEVDFE